MFLTTRQHSPELTVHLDRLFSSHLALSVGDRPIFQMRKPRLRHGHMPAEYLSPPAGRSAVSQGCRGCHHTQAAVQVGAIDQQRRPTP